MSSFYVILTGMLVAGGCSIVGCFLVLRKMAMIGDAISHAVLPGIVIAFLISGSRDSVWMMFGAAVLGLLTVYLIQLFQQSGLQSDAAITDQCVCFQCPSGYGPRFVWGNCLCPVEYDRDCWLRYRSEGCVDYGRDVFDQSARGRGLFQAI